MKLTLRTLRGRIRIAIEVLSILFLFSAAFAVTPEEVMKKVRSKYAAMRSLSASFKQSFYWKLADRRQGFEGRIYVAGDGRFRFETTGKNPQLIVSDGESIWNYSKANGQVIIRSVRKADRDLCDPKGFILRYSEKFRPGLLREEKLGGKKCYLLELTPGDKCDTDFKRVNIWVDGKRWLIVKIEYADLNGNITSYTFSDIRVNPKLKGSLFTFSPPEGVEVIDMR